MKRRLRRWILVCVFALLISVFYLLKINKLKRSKFLTSSYELLHQFSLARNGSCKLPENLDPWDESVKKYIEHLPDRVQCPEKTFGLLLNPFYYNFLRHLNYYQIGEKKEQLSYVDHNGVLRFSSIFNLLKCYYIPFERTDEDDDHVRYGTKKVLDQENGLNMEANDIEFVQVICYENGNEVYSNTHSWPSRISVPKNKTEFNSKYSPSVLIIVIESLSTLNYQRFMKKTKKAFDNLNGVYLKGLTKLADNSLPNMMPFLTGRFIIN